MKNPLPYILEKITGHTRHKVDNIEWSGSYVTYNLFRVWEKVFWRRSGKSNKREDTIRIEAMTESFYDKNGKHHVKHTFYTKEAMIVFAEGLVHEFVKQTIKDWKRIIGNWKWEMERLVPQLENIFKPLQPQFVFEGFSVVPPTEKTPKGYLFAIGYDTFSGDNNGGSGTSVTVAHTCTGSNRALVEGTSVNDSQTETGLTYAGTSAPLIDSKNPDGYGYNGYFYLHYLVNPASGTNNLVSSITGVTYVSIQETSYSGVVQNATPDNHNYVTVDGPTTTPSFSLTTIADNCWVVSIFSSGSYAAYTGTGGTTVRGQNYCGVADKGPKTPAGSQTINISSAGGAANWRSLNLSMAPLTVVVPTVTTQAVSSIDKTTATGNGNVTDDGGDTITERGTVISTSANPTTSDTKFTTSGTTGAFTTSMTGLTSGTHYHVRAYAINGQGTSYGSDVEFNTIFEKAITAVGSGLGVVLKGMAKSLSVSGVGVGAVLKQMAKTLSATAQGSATTFASKVYAQLLEAVSNGVATISTVQAKVLSALSDVTATITRTPAKIMSATATGISTVTKQMAVVLSTAGTGIGAVAKTVGKLMSATAQGIATVTNITAKVLATIADATATLTAGRAVIMNATANAIATITTNTGKVIAGIVKAVALLRIDFWKSKYTSESETYTQKHSSEGEDYNLKYPHGQ